MVFGDPHHFQFDVVVIGQGVALAHGAGGHPLCAVGVVQRVLHHLDRGTLGLWIQGVCGDSFVSETMGKGKGGQVGSAGNMQDM